MSQKRTRKRSPMRILALGLATFVGLVLTLAAFLAALVLTPSGLKLAARAAQSLYTPLSIASVEGPLYDATIKGIQLHQDGLDVEVGAVRLRIAQVLFTDPRLHIAELAVSDVAVNVAPSQSTEEPSGEPLGQIVLPVAVQADRIALENAQVCLPEMCVTLDRFETGVLAQASRVTITKPTVGTVAVNHLASATPAPEPPPAKPANPNPTEAIEALFAQSLMPALPDVVLPIGVQVDGLTLQAVRMDEATLAQDLALSLSAEGSQVDVTHLSVLTHDVAANLQASANLSAGYTVEARAKARLTQAEHGIDVHVHGTLSDRIHAELATSAAPDWRLALAATPAQAGLPFDVQCTGTQPLPTDVLARLGLPDAPTLPVDVRNVLLHAQGDFEQWSLALEAHAQTLAETGKKFVEPMAVQARINARKLTAAIEELKVAAASASVTATGKASLTRAGAQAQAQISSHIADSERLLRLARAFADIPASVPVQGQLQADVGVSVQTDAALAHPKLNIDLAQAEVSGTVIAGHLRSPLRAQVQLKAHDVIERLTAQIDTLSARVGNNRVQAQGRVSPKDVDLTARVDITHPEEILAGSKGTVTGSVSAKGPLPSADISVQADIGNLAYNNIQVQKAQLTAQIARLFEAPSKVALAAESVSVGEIAVRTADVSLQGTRSEHKAQVRVDGDPVRAQLAAAGSLNAALTQWKGQLQSAKAQYAKEIVSLQEAFAVAVDLNKASAQVNAHCWQHNTTQATVCLKERATIADKGAAALALHALDLSKLRAYLPRGTRVQGTLAADVTAKWTSPTAQGVQLEANVLADNLKVRTRVDERRLRLDLRQAKAQVSLAKKNARIRSAVSLKDTKRPSITADITVADIEAKRALSGNLDVDKLDLSELNALLASLGAVSQASGRLDVHLEPRGTLEKPELFGSMALADMVLAGSAIPVDMAPSQLKLTFAGTRGDIAGSLASPEGAIALSGSADWSDLTNPKVHVRAQGDNLSVVLEPYVTASVSPDITVESQDGALTLSGVIAVPRARLQADSVPESAVSVSGDEVLVDKTMQPIASKSSPMKIHSSMKIRLGDDVRIEAFGLASRVSGELNVEQNNDRLGLNGQLKLNDGRFQAFGQDLLIRKGDIVFTGPVTDPILSLEAIRHPDAIESNVTVGIRVSGTSRQLKSELFSEPDMSETAQLSYLLRGQGLESSSEGNNSLSMALLSLGLSQTGQLVSGIGQALSIRELGVATTGVGDEQQLVVSGYVLPDLQVKYAMGLFDSLSTITLRYRVIPRLYLEASSGLNQALDLLYSFEF